MSSLATSAQLFVGCSDGTVGRAVDSASPASETGSDLGARGEGGEDAEAMESTGLRGPSGVVTRPGDAAEDPLSGGGDAALGDSLVHCSGRCSPGDDARRSCGLSFASVGAVPYLWREKMDDDMLLFVMFWSWTIMGVPLR